METGEALISPGEVIINDDSVDDAFAKLQISALQIDELTQALAAVTKSYASDIGERQNQIVNLEFQLNSLRQRTTENPAVEIPKSDLQGVCRMCADLQEHVNRLELQTVDSESSVQQAEKTITILNDELDRRFREMNTVKSERDAALTALSGSTSSSDLASSKTKPGSPTHSVFDRRMESTFIDTTNVVQSIDKLLRLSATRNSSAIQVPISAADPRLVQCLRMIDQVLASVNELKVTSSSTCTSQLLTINSSMNQLSRIVKDYESSQVSRHEDVILKVMLTERDSEVLMLRKLLQSSATSSSVGASVEIQDRINQFRNGIPCFMMNADLS